MELRHVRYFVAVAEELHFGRAARRVRVAQPALSKQVMSLERELGARLLDRRGRRVELTGAGRVFLEKARIILEGVGEAERAAARAGRGEAGRLSVGFTGMALYSVVPGIVRAFGERYPGVDLSLREMCTRTMAEALLGKRVDVGFLHPPVGAAAGAGELALKTVRSEPLIVALPEGHDLLGLPEVPLARLADERFVVFPRDEGPELYDRIVGMCRASGFSPAVVDEAASPQTAVGLVAAGLGVSLVWECMRNLARPGVVYRPLAERTPRMRTALAWRRGDPSPVLEAFLALASDAAGKAGEPEVNPHVGRPDDAVLTG